VKVAYNSNVRIISFDCDGFDEFVADQQGEKVYSGIGGKYLDE